MRSYIGMTHSHIRMIRFSRALIPIINTSRQT